MDEPKVTADLIISTLKTWIADKVSIPPSLWVDAALKLSVLMGDESDKLYDLEQECAKVKVDIIEADPKTNVSRAKAIVEATDTYRAMRCQKARVEQIFELIRICKIQARMRMEEFRAG